MPAPAWSSHLVMLSLLASCLLGCSAKRDSGKSGSESSTTAVASSSRPAAEAANEPSSAEKESPKTVEQVEATSQVQDNPPRSGEQDDTYRQLLVGTWEDDYQGHRTMTLNEDGTGTMVVELTGWKATLFASRLEFTMQWKVENGCLRKETIDGEPEQVVNAILKMMGDQVKEPILELTEDRLLLLDKDGETKYDWQRAERLAKPNSSR